MDFIPCTEDKNGVSGMDHLPAKEEKIEEKAQKSAFHKENKIVSFLMVCWANGRSCNLRFCTMTAALASSLRNFGKSSREISILLNFK
ncbi:hypothetical protein TNIN_10941 [Trichonephila inaurata madagascariensis]|uniref:Uncharacterized protein n=1 Tax=Trichonephila inaurata madagascariensis TaxID=2747483 RepID=A0A8X6XX12_9ARAC|nr:hypothetical protein TNIN_10941 [Trichonephila inaurata madagascariensis]